MCGYTRDGFNATLRCSNTTNTYTTDGNQCINKNGIGGDGEDNNYTPRSGGGGGYCGGDSAIHDGFIEPCISDSGSSYVKECLSGKLDEELCFFNVKMNVDVREGNGKINLKQVWECEDSNCLFCKDAANECKRCIQNHLRYNGSCFDSCPIGTVQNGSDCIDCNESCYECVKYPYICLSCKPGFYLYHYECLSECPETTTVQNGMCVDCQKPCFTCSGTITTCTYCIAGYFLYEKQCISECPLGTFKDVIRCSPCIDICANCTERSDFCLDCIDDYFLFNNHCYSDCTVLNNETRNEFYGKNHEMKKCQICEDLNCVDCSENYSICNKCNYLYSLNQSTFHCDLIPTNAFSISNYFSNSHLFSSSGHFTYSNEFSKSTAFTHSNRFSPSEHFTYSNRFSPSDHFTHSNRFSPSEHFTYLNRFSQTEHFTHSNEFSKSTAFSYSNRFSSSEHFTHSNRFSPSEHFTYLNRFSPSEHFTHSKEFSKSTAFTYSNRFSNSIYFSHISTKSMQLTTPFIHKTTLSLSAVLSYIMKRSVSYSISYFYSDVYSMIDDKGQISFTLSKLCYSYNLPYIIRIYSPSYIQSIFIFELVNRKRISKEFLIAICCGSAAIFFFILALIIMIYQKYNEQKSNDCSMISDDEYSSNENPKYDEANEVTVNSKSDSDTDINFWL